MRLLEKYRKEVIPAMKEKFGYKSNMIVPKIGKVIVNVGFGKFISGKTSDERKKIADSILTDLAQICGQRPVLTKAKKSIAGFKIREGQPVGVKVTLRKKVMYDFLERLINIVLPRTRDFRGINPNSIDKEGNLTIGIKEHIVFPEVSPEVTRFNFGLEITVVIKTDSRKEGMELLKLLGFPIKS